MATVISPVADVCRAAKRAARELARSDTAVKNAALEAIAAALLAREQEILEANERDMQAGREADIGDALLDRLRLDEARVAAIAQAVCQIAALADPVGEVIDGQRLANGLDVRKVRVPLGVVAVDLRGAAERDDRRRRAVLEVGQRDRPARILLGGAFQRRARADRLRGDRRGRPAGGLRRASCPAAVARSSPSSPRRRTPSI